MPQSASPGRDRRLFDESPEPTWLYDEETLRFLDVNRAAVAVYGYTRNEFLRLTINDLQAVSADRPRQPAGASLRGEFRHQTKHGDQMDVEVVGSRLTIDGRQTRLEIVRDVSFDLALESQLRHAQNIETVGRVTGGIAHDFNNVLAAIVGHIEVLSDYMAPGDPRSAEVQAIRDAAELAADLTRQLVVFSSKQRLQQTVLNLNDVIERARTGLQRLMRDSIALETRPADALWSVNADAGQIFQIVLNLVVNARDAMPDGGVVTLETANVTIGPDVARRRSIEPGDYVELSVTDTGTGIPPQVRVRLFEPFFTTKDRHRGTGLGLSTVYGIVRQSGGHVDVRSAPGRGTAFDIILPQVAAPVPARAELSIGTALPRGTETVLVVEDEEAVRLIVRRVLEAQGYAILEARDGNDAMRVAAQRGDAIDLVLSDVIMPGMGGRELARSLATTRPGLPILFMSGYNEEGELAGTGGDLGDGVLAKPFTAETLARQVREALDGRPSPEPERGEQFA